MEQIRLFFRRQDLSNRDTRNLFQVLNSVVIISFLGSLGTVAAVFVFQSQPTSRAVMIALTALLLISFILLRLRILGPAQVMAPLGLYASITYIIVLGSGLHDIAMIAYAGIIIVASLTLGRTGLWVSTVLIVAAVFGLFWLESTGRLVTDASNLTTPDDPFLISIVVLAISGTLSVLLNRYTTSLKQARDNEEAQIAINNELRELQAGLEGRVAERTRELESMNQMSGRRAAQFESIAQTARAMTSFQPLDQLLPQITEMVSRLFGFYHVGIFLLDPEKKNAVLTAANSEGGKRMIGRGHQLRIGQEGIVGYVTSTGFPRIALDTGQDAVYFNNPELPATRSEIALPLKIGNEVIGALDVQSTEPSAFNNEDISSLSILADQVSISIQNTKQYETTLRSLEQSQVQYRQYLREEWSRLAREQNVIGFRYSDGNGVPLEGALPLGEAGQAALQGRIYQRAGRQSSDMAELAVPVRLRGEVIGVLSVSIPGRRQWLEDDIDIAEAVSERLALAIENARLFQSTNQRAQRERIVSDIAAKISGNIRIDSLLETTAQELSHALSGSEVVIQLHALDQAGGPQ